MSQPPWGDDQPTAGLPAVGLPGHPDPAPEPGPPQPIPPPDPAPAPEPPHASTPPDAAERPPPVWPLPVDTERTWHLPPPPNLHRGAHEANWPISPGQRQWQPEPHHDGDWHPQHERRPDAADVTAQPGPAAGQAAAGAAEPRKRRAALWVSLALALTLLLCGGGAVSAFLLLRNADNGGGAPDPATAVTRFLSAVYSEQDADAASELVCREARDDKKVTAKVEEVRGYARQYDAPQFRWATPSVASQDEERATVAVGLTMTTRDEKTAEQRLTFTVVKKTGWWVCEVSG